MSDPRRDLTDADLGRLLAMAPTGSSSTTMADRIVAEATRADRVRPIPGAISPRRPRRPWMRRPIVIGIVALNLIAASAIAATFGGGHFALPGLAAISARLFPTAHHAESVRVHHSRPVPLVHGAALSHVETRVATGPALISPPVTQRQTVAVRPNMISHPIMARPGALRHTDLQPRQPHHALIERRPARRFDANHDSHPRRAALLARRMNGPKSGMLAPRATPSAGRFANGRRHRETAAARPSLENMQSRPAETAAAPAPTGINQPPEPARWRGALRQGQRDGLRERQRGEWRNRRGERGWPRRGRRA